MTNNWQTNSANTVPQVILGFYEKTDEARQNPARLAQLKELLNQMSSVICNKEGRESLWAQIFLNFPLIKQYLKQKQTEMTKSAINVAELLLFLRKMSRFEPTPEFISRFHERFAYLVSRWEKAEQIFAIRLGQPYDLPFKVEHLNKYDEIMFKVLRHAQKQHGFEMCFAFLEKIHKISPPPTTALPTTYHPQTFISFDATLVCEGSSIAPIHQMTINAELIQIDPFAKDEPMLLMVPKTMFRKAFQHYSQKLFLHWDDAFTSVQTEKPSPQTTEKYESLVRYSEFLSNLSPTQVTRVMECLEIVDTNHLSNDRLLSKSFISSFGIVNNISSELVNKLREWCTCYGGVTSWLMAIAMLSKNLRVRFDTLLAWIVSDSRDSVSLNDQSTNHKVKLILQSFVNSQQRSNSLSHCLVQLVCTFGNLSVAQSIVLNILDFAFRLRVGYAGQPVTPSAGTMTYYADVSRLLLSFGYHASLCELVINWLREKFNVETRTKKELIYLVWSMLNEQTSLRKMRFQSIKNVLHFGRLIGSNQKLTARKRSVLGLVLREFSSSRLSLPEFDSLVQQTSTRTTMRPSTPPPLISINSSNNLTTNSQQTTNNPISMNFKILVSDPPSLVKNIFPAFYFDERERSKYHFSPTTISAAATMQNQQTQNPPIPHPSLNQYSAQIYPLSNVVEDCSADGPLGLNFGTPKFKFTQKLVDIVFNNYSEVDIMSTDNAPFKDDSVLDSNVWPRDVNCMLISLAASLYDWNRFINLISLLPNKSNEPLATKATYIGGLDHLAIFAEQLSLAVCIGCKNFMNSIAREELIGCLCKVSDKLPPLYRQQLIFILLERGISKDYITDLILHVWRASYETEKQNLLQQQHNNVQTPSTSTNSQSSNFSANGYVGMLNGLSNITSTTTTNNNNNNNHNVNNNNNNNNSNANKNVLEDPPLKRQRN